MMRKLQDLPRVLLIGNVLICKFSESSSLVGLLVYEDGVFPKISQIGDFLRKKERNFMLVRLPFT